jgi:hypothetical protein
LPCSIEPTAKPGVTERAGTVISTGHLTTAFDIQRFIAAVKLESEAKLDGGETIEARRAVVAS